MRPLFGTLSMYVFSVTAQSQKDKGQYYTGDFPLAYTEPEGLSVFVGSPSFLNKERVMEQTRQIELRVLSCLKRRKKETSE